MSATSNRKIHFIAPSYCIRTFEAEPIKKPFFDNGEEMHLRTDLPPLLIQRGLDEVPRLSTKTGRF